MKHETENKKLIGRFAPAVLFVAFIFAMAIWFIINPKADYSSSEKRYLQKFPDASFENISSGDFGEQFETFFADHFPSRNMWVGFNAYYTLGLGNNGASGVYNCANGYLINKPVSTENNLKKNMGAITDFKQIMGDVPVTAMFAPSTGYIASDALPLIHDSYNDDLYFPEIQKLLNDGSVDFVDLRDSFKSAYSDGAQLYYRTDHHWTTQGAYLAYRELCAKLQIEPAQQSSFKVESYKNFYGTTYSSSGFWLTQPDTVEVWRNHSNTDNIHVKITEGTEVKESDSMYFYSHIDEDDKYPVFLDGNHALTEITNSRAKGGTILLIKDSFSHCLAPFLAENYKKVILVDMRYYKQDVSQIAADEKPEQIVVLYGIDNILTDTDIVWLK